MADGSGHREAGPIHDHAARTKKLGGLESEALSHDATELSRRIGVSLNTARDWRRFHRIPPMWWRAVRALVQGDLGVISEAWAGWHLSPSSGDLCAPEAGGYCFEPRDLYALRQRPPTPQFERELAQLAAEVRALQQEARALRQFPQQADFVSGRFEHVRDPAQSLEEQLSRALARIEILEHAERVRESVRGRAWPAGRR